MAGVAAKALGYTPKTVLDCINGVIKHYELNTLGNYSKKLFSSDNKETYFCSIDANEEVMKKELHKIFFLQIDSSKENFKDLVRRLSKLSRMFNSFVFNGVEINSAKKQTVFENSFAVINISDVEDDLESFVAAFESLTRYFPTVYFNGLAIEAKSNIVKELRILADKIIWEKD